MRKELNADYFHIYILHYAGNSFTVILKIILNLFYRFKNPSKLQESVISKVSKESRINYGVNDFALVVETLYSLLSRGLENRVNLIMQLVEADYSWPVNDKAKNK